ncbi:MAG: hypothetical protein Satyrvirus23_17 [Satyrvirus sp.]|uniref:Uncharacterized protein n=1 Tax=Satyrvirus sp. TaxID=2487771 RepID=A0A3G5AG47_9VIRU|nr:MAG: hypothetical protein Satyrvirus23_17 [Satyrvirus sp.]
MNHKYINSSQIANLDYPNLVNLLMNKISPYVRRCILERLNEINNQLIYEMEIPQNINIPENNDYANMRGTPEDFSRIGMPSSRKKDLAELKHPSAYVQNYSNQNQFQFNSPINPAKAPSGKINTISLDNIIDDLEKEKESESLDDKLEKISRLHKKIILDKKQRRKERNKL